MRKHCGHGGLRDWGHALKCRADLGLRCGASDPNNRFAYSLPSRADSGDLPGELVRLNSQNGGGDMAKTNTVVDLRKRALEGSQALETAPLPELVPDGKPTPTQFSRAVVAGLVVAGSALGLLAYQALQGQSGPSSSSGPVVVQTAVVESKRFESSIRAGGTLGATNFAVIRAPRMRGARDRGGGWRQRQLQPHNRNSGRARIDGEGGRRGGRV